MNPFQRFPHGSFLVRALVPAAIAFAIGFFAMGVLSSSTVLPSELRSPAAGDPAERAALQYRNLIQWALEPPENCREGVELSSAQEKQCREFRARLQGTAALAAVPVVVAVVFLLIFWELALGTYRNASRLVASQEPRSHGTVTEPPQATGDLFSWAHCFRVISVELKDRTQLRVYLAPEAPMPRPGDPFGIYDLGPRWGAPRKVGVFFAPHVAVMSGARR